MNTGVIATRYAKALLEYAKMQGKEENVYVEVKALARHYSDMPDLKRAIDNPVLSVKDKLDVLLKATEGKPASEEIKRFLALVLKERREKFLQFMVWSYIDLYQKDKNILLGKLITAVPSEKLVKQLEELVVKQTNGYLEIEQRVDPKLIGGYIFEVEGYRMDASVANQLERVKQQFIARNRRIV